MQKTRRGWGCLALFIGVLGFAAGLGTVYWAQQRGKDRVLADQLDGHGPIRPPSLRNVRPCNKRNAQEVRLDDAMLSAAIAASNGDWGISKPVHGYAVSYFAWHWRLSNRLNACPPDQDKVIQLASILDATGWPEANTQLGDLELAEILPPSKARADGLRHIAFLGWIPPGPPRGEDSRPYARQLLAEQGDYARPAAEQALREIGGSTRLGTSAAFLAVAIEPTVALPQVEAAMQAQLALSRGRRTKAFQTGGVVPAIRDSDANRLIELGYALARGGSAARPFSAPVVAMLDERIARASPPFGLMAARPTEFCRIARQIGGRLESVANSKDFCRPGYRGGDGAPRNGP